MSRPLPRFTDTTAQDRAKIARIIMEVGEPVRSSDVTTGTDHTDYARLRGIPAIGRNVTGAIPGTSPHAVR